LKIKDVQIEGFGVWSGLSAPELPGEMIVFAGHNEAGKTTFMQFLRTVLYGFSPERRKRYLPPLRHGEPGGSLSVTSALGDFQIRRTTQLELEVGQRNIGEVAILSQDGAPKGQHLLTMLLAGLDEATYSNVFAVGLREIQELGALDDTDAAEQLYKLTSGLDRVSLVDVVRKLEGMRGELLSADEQPALLGQLHAQRREVIDRLRRLTSQGRRWTQLAEQQSLLEREVVQLQEKTSILERKARVIDLANQVRTPWLAREEVVARREEIGELYELPEQAVQRLEELNTEISRHEQQRRELQRQRKRIRQEAKALPIRRRLWSHGGRISAMMEHEPWIHSLEDQTTRLESEVGQLEASLRKLVGRTGTTHTTILKDAPQIPPRVLSALKGPAKIIREESTRLKQAQAERESHRKQAREAETKLEAALHERGAHHLVDALEEGSETVARFRRRLQLDERLENMREQRTALTQQSHELLGAQVLPLPQIVMLGGAFIFGVVLVLSGILGVYVFGLSVPMAWLMGIVGVFSMAGAAGAKATLERSAKEHFEDYKRKLELLKLQVDEIIREREQLDRKLPSGEGPFASRLSAAETTLHKLEELLPLEAAQNAAELQSRAAKERMTQAAEAIKLNRHRWRQELRAAKLPENLTPRQVRGLADHSEEIATLRRKIESRREELERRQTEYAEILQRVRQLVDDTGLRLTDDDVHGRLREMAAALKTQQQLVGKRREFSRELRHLRSEQEKAGAEIERLTQLRDALLEEAGVADEEELLHATEQQELAASLETEFDTLCQQITLLLNARVEEDDIRSELEEHDQETLELAWSKAQSRLEESQKRIGELRQQQGEISHEMKTLGEDRRGAEAQFELGRLNKQIEQACQRWQVVAAASVLLESIRKIYESERQPETLSEASMYLEKLTEGRYARIWTPLSANVLRVDDAHGDSLPVEVLSRGTREAVFLSLRLALLGAYSRRGVVLPLVLDDVLVNFDAQRARAAARVLHEFSQNGTQVLVFTCHEHIAEIFAELGVEIRDMPDHAATHGVAVVTPREIEIHEVELHEDEEYFDDVDEIEEPAIVDEDELSEDDHFEIGSDEWKEEATELDVEEELDSVDALIHGVLRTRDPEPQPPKWPVRHKVQEKRYLKVNAFDRANEELLWANDAPEYELAPVPKKRTLELADDSEYRLAPPTRITSLRLRLDDWLAEEKKAPSAARVRDAVTAWELQKKSPQKMPAMDDISDVWWESDDSQNGEAA